MEKARHMEPDWVTWNGYAGQYKDHPLKAEVGENVRFYVVAAGPSFDLDFHVVGTLLDRAWLDGTTTHVLEDVQTVSSRQAAARSSTRTSTRTGSTRSSATPSPRSTSARSAS